MRTDIVAGGKKIALDSSDSEMSTLHIRHVPVQFWKRSCTGLAVCTVLRSL
jgi:hypothetical protein